MELRHLRYFVAVAEELSFRRAATRLNIAPPPLSVQIRNLEAEIGAALLSRSGHRIELTNAGRTFLGHARQTLAEAGRGIAMARRAAGGDVGELSIGYNPMAEFRLFPMIVPAFKSAHPGINLQFHSLKTPQQVTGLRDGDVDVGFVCPPVPSGDFELAMLTQEPFAVAVPADHRLAGKATVSFEDLSGEPLIVHSRIIDPESFRQIEERFDQAGAILNVAYELESALSMINFVACGSGCSIVPDYVRAFQRDGVAFKTLAKSDMVRSLALIKASLSSKTADIFFAFVVEQSALMKSAQ